MPYISKDDQDKIFFSGQIKTPGELNFVITTLCLEYLNASEKRYKDYNEIVGVLECAKQEFYRRAVSPYEDKKIIENGDVY